MSLMTKLAGSAYSEIRSERIYYINPPFIALLRLFAQITGYLFLLFVCTVHPVMVGFLGPLYVLVLFLYRLFWKTAQRYAFRFFPILLCTLVVDIPVFFLARLVRELILFLIETVL